MSRRLRLLLAFALLFSAPAVEACTITGVQSITGLSANLGTYNAAAPGTLVLSLTITFNKINNGRCDATLAFLSATNPAQMSGPGLQSLLYQVADSGGTSLLYTTTPGNRITFSGNANNQSTIAFTTSIRVGALASQSGLPSGTYSDTSVSARGFDGTSNIPVPGAFALNVTSNVVSSCTIGGVSNPVADTATIPVIGGVVTTAPINKAYASAVCSSQTTLQVTSLSGGVVRAGGVSGGFTNIINYTVSAIFSGATSTLNTATIATAAGSEAGTSAPTSTTTPSGTLSVTITPQTPAQPLAAGSYSDTLRITLTPQ